MSDMAGLNQHHDGGKQSRHERLEEGRDQEPDRAAIASAGLPSEESEEQAENLRGQQDRHCDCEKIQRSLRIEPRPSWKEREARWEIFGPDVTRLEDEHDTDDELQHP